MKKTFVMSLASALICVSAFGFPRAFYHRPAFRPHAFHHHYHHRHYAPPILPFAVGLAAGAAVSHVVSQPVTVVQPSPPVVVSPGVRAVWVPGQWVETRSSAGIVLTRQWVEGHWEYR